MVYIFCILYKHHLIQIFRNRVRPYLDSSGSFSCKRFTLKNLTHLCPVTGLVKEYIGTHVALTFLFFLSKLTLSSLEKKQE